MYIVPKSGGYIPSDFGIVEKNDCAVRAIANVGAFSYPLALKLMAQEGRPRGRGTPWDTLHKVYTMAGAFDVTYYGERMRRLSEKRGVSLRPQGMTLETFLERHPKGRYVVVITKHALAVVDGAVVDMGKNRAGKRLMATYKFEG